MKRHYFIKDQLGNVRMVLTEEQQTDAYPVASMETAKAQLENTYYQNIEETRSAKPPGYPDDPYTDPNTQAAKLNGNGNKIGPAILLKVMSGDQVNIRANAWYRLNGNQPGNPVSPLNDLLAALSGAVTNFVHGKFSALQLQQPGVLTPGIADMVTRQTNDYNNNSKPKAYLNWVLLDEQFKYVSSSSGFEQVGEDQELKPFVKAGLPINRNGYLYVFTNNTSPVDVYFDNLQVSHVRGPLIEENTYSPWGLKLAGISSVAAGKLENKKNKFQNQEYNDDLGVDIYEFKWRMDDPQTGRFWQVDPLADKYVYNSTYAFSENKVTGHVELEGLEAVPSGTPMGYLAQAFSEVTTAGANLIDKAFSFFTGTKSEVTVPLSNNASIVTTASSTTTLSTNVSGWIYGSNTSSVPFFKTETKTDSKVEVKNEITVGPVTTSSKTNVNGSGFVLTGQVKTKIDGVPVIASLSQSADNKTGETKTTGKLATGTTNVNAFGQIEIVNKGKSTTTNLSVGLEKKTGNVKNTFTLGKAL